MNTIQELKYYPGSKEELLPGYCQSFPYISSRAELDHFSGCSAPWHWHKAVELFYIESGQLEYCTPNHRIIFPTGSCGFVNSNILHTTHILTPSEPTVQLLHIFDPAFLADEIGSQIDARYIKPLATASQIELLSFFPQDDDQTEIIDRIRKAFCLSKDTFGYEMRLRSQLCEIWLRILQQTDALLRMPPTHQKDSARIKLMLVYIHEHYAEKLPIAELAQAAHLSERECYRTFQDALHTTPTEYLTRYRLQVACQMLTRSDSSITTISQLCGFGSSSYFGKIFARRIGCTPLEYRQHRQDCNK